MNKIFKVVWSKSKECYVVVSEVAKNNGGKKKALASVLAGLAIMGAAAQMGTPVQAGANNGGNAVNLWADKKLDGSANSANTVGANSVAVGNNLVAGSASTTPTGRLGGTAIAIGVDSQAKDDRNIAIGYNNTTEGQDSVAMGSNVIAGTGQSIAIGSTNTDDKGVQTQTIARGKVSMKNGRPEPAAAIAIGAGAQALDGSGVLAMGQLAKAVGNNDVAIGTQTKVEGNNSTAIGSTAQALGNSSAAYGTQAIANGLGATAVGPGANAGTGSDAAPGATAVGRGAKAIKEGASALGWAANASVENAAAIGRDTTANIAGGVALGYQSVTTTAAGVQGYNPASDRTNKYSTQGGAVGTSTLAAVSVGNGTTATRQITGLAAGTADTDAVNVAQLKNVNLKYAADTGNSDVLLKDGTLTVNGDNDIISTSVESNGAIKVAAKKGANITTNADGKAVAPTTNGIATTDNVTQAINNSGWKVTSLNNGGTTNGTTSEKVSPGDTVTFSAGKNIVLDQAGKQFTYSLNKDVDLTNGGSLTIGDTKINNGGMTITGGPSVTKTGIDAGSKKITNVANGTDDTDAVNYSQIKDLRTEVKAGTGVSVNKTQGTDGHDIYTVSANATGGTASTESVVKKAAATGDTNIADVSVAGGKNVNDPGAQYEVSVSKNAVKDAAREAVTVNNGGNTDNPITVTPTDDATNHNTTYAVKFDGNKAAKQIPLTYKANGTGDKTVTLDKGLDFTNGTNTKAEIGNDGVVKFNLNDNVALTNAGSLTVGDTKVNNDGLTITGGPSVTKNGIDAGNQKITNVAPGTISSTSTDAVNGSQLYDVDQKFNNTVKLTGNAGATDGQALNKANGLSFGVIGADNGKYISTSANGSDVTVDLSTAAKKLLNNTVEVKGTNAATVTSTTETTADGGTKTIYTVDVASTGAVAKSSWNVKSSADTANGGAEATGHEAAAKNIADTNTVEMVAGKNLTVKQTSDTDGAKVEFALNKDLKDLTSVTTEKVTTKEIGLQDAAGNTTTIKKDGDRITYTNDGGTTVNKVANLADEKHIAPGSYAVQNDGSVTMTYVDGNGDPVANDEAKITGIAKQDLSNITDAGKQVITGLGTVVKAGDNVTVSEASDATTGQKTYTVNAVTPAIYTKADGTKVVKRPDGTYTTNIDGSAGNDVPASDVIVSIQDAAGNRTGGNSIVNNVGSAIDKTGTSTGDTFLTNLNNAATDNPFAAVNVRDLKSTADSLKASELHIAPTSVATGSTEVVGGTASGNTNPGAATQAYKYNATTKQVELTFNDGNGKAVNGPKAVIDFSDLNTGGTAASSWNIKSSANTTDGGAIGDNHDAAAQNIADNKTVEFQAGKNLVVKQTNDAANGNATVEFSLSDNITAGKDGANGKDGSVGATGKDGSSVVLNGKDGSIGMTGPKGQDGKDGINGRDGADISITSAKGEQVLVNRDPAHNGDTDKAERIVYVPKDANGNPIQGADGKNIVREVATMDDGLRFTGNNTSTENKQKLGSLVKVEGEGVTEAQANSFQSATGNIAVVADGADKLTVKLNKDLKGLDSVTTKEVKLGDANDNISIKKAGDRITYTTPGSTDTHKVATLDDEMHIKDTTYTVDGNKKVTMTYVDGNGNPVAGKTAVIDLSGLPVGETDTDMRIKEGTYTAQNGKVTLNTVDKGGNPVTGKDVVIDGINTNNYVAGDNVTLTPDTDAAGKPVVKINAALSTEKVVKKAGADNLATVSTASGNVAGDKGETYEVAVTKGDIENNAEISYKANGGTAQKTTLANGFNFTSDDNSVAITTGANGKVNFKVDTTGIHGKAFNLDVNKEGTGKVETAQTAAATPSVEKGTKFVAGNNLSIRHDGINGDANYDHQVTYALNSDLKGITSITNNGGATMNFGPNEVSMTGGNLNMGDHKITNVKNGTDKSDVATVGQLTKVTSNDNTVAINKTTDADGAPVYDLSVQGGGHDPRVDQLGEEIGRVGAQGAALAALKPIQYDPLEPTQIMAGYGNYRGNSAIAMGVAHYKNESTLMHAGVSWAGGSRHMMANAGVTWKVGNRDSEAAVADRYRKGPISSAYAMQQEMASVKAQNAGLKTEVSDLKAENEQMKAQIAAMMAKLGM